jgi:hypothetical protein
VPPAKAQDTPVSSQETITVKLAVKTTGSNLDTRFFLELVDIAYQAPDYETDDRRPGTALARNRPLQLSYEFRPMQGLLNEAMLDYTREFVIPVPDAEHPPQVISVTLAGQVQGIEWSGLKGHSRIKVVTATPFAITQDIAPGETAVFGLDKDGRPHELGREPDRESFFIKPKDKKRETIIEW